MAKMGKMGGISRNRPWRKVKEEGREVCGSEYGTVFLKLFLYRIPTALCVTVTILVLWSSSTTILSGRFIHVCVSSRKLTDHLYCLSAGSHPNFQIPIQHSPSHSQLWESETRSRTLGTKEHQNSSNSNNNSGGYIIKQMIEVPEGSSNSAESIMNEKTMNNYYNASNKETTEKLGDEVGGGGSKMGSRDQEEDGDIIAMKAIEEQLREQRSWINNNNNGAAVGECGGGRGIYVYELPAKFNKELVGQCGEMVPWMDFCKYFSNEGLGEQIPELGDGWYNTHQYALEPIFHSRVLKHPCRVYNQEEAKLFYVPYYGGLDILRWHFKNNVSSEVKDSLGLELIEWLSAQKPWAQNSGKDHVFVLGKISWDFRRNANGNVNGYNSNNPSWGTKFLELHRLQNPIKLLIERQPWHQNDVGIPHPTFFHPHSDDDIFAWQWKAIRSHRKYLVGFAGGARPESSENIRSLLIDHCTTTEDGRLCRHVNCTTGDCDRPKAVIELFLESEFCLQPPGDSPTRKSVFDSLISGCIPVFFDPFTAYYQYPWHLPEDHGKYSVMIDKKELKRRGENVVKKLEGISLEKREEMRSYIIYELMPGLVYGDSNNVIEKFQDAYHIAINNLLQRVSML